MIQFIKNNPWLFLIIGIIFLAIAAIYGIFIYKNLTPRQVFLCWVGSIGGLIVGVLIGGYLGMRQ